MLSILLALIFFSSPLYSQEEQPMVVLTTSYNNKNWVKKNITSILRQNYSNYRLIYIDDASQDGTADALENFMENIPKKIEVQIIRNKNRAGALANIYHAIHDLCADNEIVISLDGDDWFYDNQVLQRINLAYNSAEVWLTHGTMIEFPSYHTGWSIPIPALIVKSNTFRSYRCPSHLRTFYAWLFKKIQKEDLLYEGVFFPMTWDQAMMFPMIEMAGERHAFIPSKTYVYNMSNPINDNKVDPQFQRDLEAYIRAKTPYARLEHR